MNNKNCHRYFNINIINYDFYYNFMNNRRAVVKLDRRREETSDE